VIRGIPAVGDEGSDAPVVVENGMVVFALVEEGIGS
jgi:hypothetical protein